MVTLLCRQHLLQRQQPEHRRDGRMRLWFRQQHHERHDLQWRHPVTQRPLRRSCSIAPRPERRTQKSFNRRRTFLHCRHRESNPGRRSRIPRVLPHVWNLLHGPVQHSRHPEELSSIANHLQHATDRPQHVAAVVGPDQVVAPSVGPVASGQSVCKGATRWGQVTACLVLITHAMALIFN